MFYEIAEDLTPQERRDLQDIVESCSIIDRDYSLKKLQNGATDTFRIISPHFNVSTLLSSQKNFNKLQYEEKDVRRGIHLARMLWASKIMGYHGLPRSGTDLASKGYHIQGNVFSDKFLVDVQREIAKFPYATSKNEKNIISGSNSLVLAEALHKLYKPVMNIISGALEPSSEMERQYIENTFIQRLHNKNGDGDVQKVFHSDTFFPAFKFWFFPFEVTLNEGPFAYIPFSNDPDRSDDLLEWYYKQSVDIVTNSYDNKTRTYGHAEGSFRILPEELKSFGFDEMQMVVPANTLVVANVLGFHRRSDAITEGFRDAIHGSIRTESPFA